MRECLCTAITSTVVMLAVPGARPALVGFMASYRQRAATKACSYPSHRSALGLR